MIRILSMIPMTIADKEGVTIMYDTGEASNICELSTEYEHLGQILIDVFDKKEVTR